LSKDIKLLHFKS